MPNYDTEAQNRTIETRAPKAPMQGPDRDKLATDIEAYRTHAQDGEWNAHLDEWERSRTHNMAFHWRDTKTGQVIKDDKPSIQMTWLQMQMQHSKIFNGHSFKPEVISKSNREVPADNEGLPRAIKDNQESLTGKSDLENVAQMRSAVLAEICESVDLIGKLREGVQMAQWYGTSFLLNGMDEEGRNTLDVLHPQDIIIDRDARNIEEARYIAYRVKRTAEYIQEKYPEHGDEVSAAHDSRVGPTGHAEAAFVPDDDKDNVWLECWYIQDRSTKSVPEEHTTEDELEVMDMLDADDDWRLDDKDIESRPVRLDDGMGGPVVSDEPFRWTLRRTLTEPMYDTGYKKIYYAAGVVLAVDGEGGYDDHLCANGRVPLHKLNYYNVPGEFWGMSVGRHIRPLTNLLDSLAESAIETVHSLTPFFVGVRGQVDFQSEQRIGSDIPLRWLWLSPKQGAEGLKDVFQYHPPAELSRSHEQLMDRINGWIDMIGGGNLRGQNNIPKDASDKFIQAFEDSDHARISEIRENTRRMVASLSSCMLADFLRYNTDEQVFRASGAAGTKHMRVIPNILETDTADRDFDIIVGGSSNMPNDPIKRNMFISETVDLLLAAPSREVAIGKLEAFDLDIKETIREIVEAHFDKLEEQQKNAPQVDPDVAQNYKQSAADIMESIGKEVAKTRPEMALRMAYELEKQARGEEPDYQTLIQGLAAIEPGAPGLPQ